MATTALASSAVFCSAARPNGRAAPKRAASKPSKLWTPKAAAVDSPTLIVKDGDAESVMSGLTAKRREVILDMEEFAETEVRPRRVFDARRAFARRRGISPRANANAQPIDKIFSAPTFFFPAHLTARFPSKPPAPPARAAPQAPEADGQELAAAGPPPEPGVPRLPGRDRRSAEGTFYHLTLVPIRPRRRGARRSLRTFSPGVSLRPGSLGFNPRHPSTPFNSTPDAFQLHPDVASNDGTTPTAREHPPGRPPRRPRRRHDHRGGASDVHEHAQHAGRDEG
eukprot:30906-Pelagococcus_subviridis.AAC.3